MKGLNEPIGLLALAQLVQRGNLVGAPRVSQLNHCCDGCGRYDDERTQRRRRIYEF